jgi:ATP-dependent DNA ligase
LRERVTRRGIGAIEPCLPSHAKRPPAGPGWIHEIKHDGEDLRWQPIEVRKALLADLLHGAAPTIVVNEHFEGDGAIIYKHACKLDCEGIVSKLTGSPYMSGRSVSHPPRYT